MSSKLWSVAVAAVAAVWLGSGGGAAAQSSVHYAGYFNWLYVGHGECVRRASQAVDGANAAFGLNVPASTMDGWFVGGNSGAVHMAIACVADDDTPSLTGAQASRVLVAIDVDTLEAGLDARVRDYLRECMGSGQCPAQVSGGGTGTGSGGGGGATLTGQPIDWGTSATGFTDTPGGVVHLTCPPRTGNHGTVWGTDIYTHDSSVCTAAKHAGRVTDAGGTVSIRYLGAQESYRGSTRNGVTTSSYGRWGQSFEFVWVEQ